MEDINQKITAVLMRAQIPVRQPEQVRQATAERRSDYSKYRTQKADYRSGNDDVMRQDTRERQVTQPIRAEKTVGRNDPCPCGSGKKYKVCHMRSDQSGSGAPPAAQKASAGPAPGGKGQPASTAKRRRPQR